MELAKTEIIPSGSCTKNRLYFKRDDLLPYYFGGNKFRIAIEFFDDMRRKGATCMVGYGNIRSNLSRVLACMSASMNIRCVIIAPTEDNDIENTFNSDIVKISGAEIVSCDKCSAFECVSATLARLKNECELPYYIYGDAHGNGNEIVPVAAYDKAFDEIVQWEQESGVEFDYIFTACGTRMMQAGLIADKKRLGSKAEVIGISIARRAELEAKGIRKMLSLY